MKLELTKTYPVINGNIILIKEITPKFFTDLLGSNPRVVKLDMGVSIYIFDRLGIRFWERNNKVYEAEFLLEMSDDEKSPRETYKGEIYLDDTVLPYPILIETIKSLETVNVTQDDDSRRFGLNIYHVMLSERKYSFWVDDKNEKVVSIHI